VAEQRHETVLIADGDVKTNVTDAECRYSCTLARVPIT
jgi:hypothetical protein